MALISKTAAASNGIDMIECVPLNMSECSGAQAKQEAYAYLALLQIKASPPFKLKSGDTAFIFCTIDHIYSNMPHSILNFQKQRIISKAAAQSICFHMKHLFKRRDVCTKAEQG